jgi:hypothetical protein
MSCFKPGFGHRYLLHPFDEVVQLPDVLDSTAKIQIQYNISEGYPAESISLSRAAIISHHDQQ